MGASRKVANGKPPRPPDSPSTAIPAALLVIAAVGHAGSYPVDTISFRSDPVRFPTAAVAFPNGTVSFPSGPVPIEVTLPADILFDFD